MFRKKNTIIIVILLFTLNFSIFAHFSNADIIQISSPIYQEMDILYSLSGFGTPSTSRPWSKAETKIILNRINEENLPSAAKVFYENIQKEINNSGKWNIDDKCFFSLYNNINIENYFQTNPEYVETENDWVYDFEKRKDFYQGQFEIGIGDWLYNYGEISFGWAPYTIDESYYKFDLDTGKTATDSPNQTEEYENLFCNYTNYYNGTQAYALLGTSNTLYQRKNVTSFVYPLKYYNYDFPRKAILSFGGINWNLSLMKGRIDWGNSHIGNLVIDDHHDFENFARFTGFSDKVKLEFLAIPMNTQIGNNIDKDVPFQRIFVSHRLEFRLLKNLTLSISESMMYKGEKIDFAYLQPATVFHNFDTPFNQNILAHFELDWQVTKGVNLYMQFASDQMKVLGESDDGPTNALAILGGGEYSCILNKGLFTTSFEVGYTMPELYRTNNVDFIEADKRIGIDHWRKYISFDFLGYPYGGDDFCLQWDSDYYINEKTSLHSFVKANYHGEFYIYSAQCKDPENPCGQPNQPYTQFLSGTTVDETYTISLKGETVLYKNYPEIKVWAETDYLFFRNRNKSTNEIKDSKFNLQIIIGIGTSL